MKYTRVSIESLGYELPPVLVTSAELEARLKPLYEQLHLPKGQLEALTGIVERRWWPAGFRLTDGAIAAARKCLAAAAVPAAQVESVVYAGVCRENFEPASACRVADALRVSSNAAVYDVSNACLGMLNGMLDVANRIELGQIRAGLVVSCETAREIVDQTIERMLRQRNLEMFKSCLATLTGGSGAAAVLLTDGSFPRNPGAAKSPRLVGGVVQAAPEHHTLCTWGMRPSESGQFVQHMTADPVAVLKHGVELGVKTWRAFLGEMGWAAGQVDKVICHQVGSANKTSILKAIGIAEEKDFSTFEFLGNMGTVSLPLTMALAVEREFLRPGERVGLLGIGSGLNCLMLGAEW
ncbi:MAG: 3-oxoacyl-ACP synthase III [Planctomycetes bacterium]|nr:3-oxoacyl-ACP synthase III [Planctomycetota bacterium]